MTVPWAHVTSGAFPGAIHLGLAEPGCLRGVQLPPDEEAFGRFREIHAAENTGCVG